MPIRARMTLWYTGLLAVVLAAVGVFVIVRLRTDLVASIDRNLHPAAQQIATGYQREGIPEFLDTSASLLAGEHAATQVLGEDGRVLVHWGDAIGERPLTGRRAHFRVVVHPVTRFGRHQLVVTAVSTAPVDRSARRVTTLLLLALPAALLVTAAGGWWLAGRALRPIDRMTSTAAAIDAGQLEGRVAEPGTHDEVGRLAATLNAMLARVEAGVKEQRRLVADASHELRTPLAAMRAEIDVSLRLDDLPAQERAVLVSVRDDVDALARTVANLLTLAKADAGELGLQRRAIDLRTLADEVAAGLAPVAGARQVQVVTGGDSAPVRADPAAMTQVLRNLVENAIDFSPAGGRVEVHTERSNGIARVSVVDNGPGIARDERERIFERFYRTDQSRSRRTGGSGLGLAIARELTQAHGGRLWAHDHAGGGAAFTLEL